jgi:hypothetical protein
VHRRTFAGRGATESPFVVILADGSETVAIGAYSGFITLGKDVVHLEMVVTEKLHECWLLGLDFLQRCPATRTHISALKGVLESQNRVARMVG